MPELPEVETVMQGLAPVMTGARIVEIELRRPNLRFPLPAGMPERLAGRRIEALGRRAKYILIHLDGADILTVHLGMTGRFTIGGEATTVAEAAFTHGAGRDHRHDHVVIHLSNGAVVTFNDARRFGYMSLLTAQELPFHKYFKNLGVEPLSDDLTPDYVAERASARRVDLKSFLMDQRVIAGLGNIYVCEALWRSRLKPTRCAQTIATAKGKPRVSAVALVDSVRGVLQDAIAAGGSSLRDYVQVNGQLGYFQKAHAVYNREHQSCLRSSCSGIVRRVVQGGRSTFYCPRCQQ